MSFCRIKSNPEAGHTELWINGVFEAGWSHFEVSEDAKGKLENMLSHAFDVGKREKGREIRTALGLPE